MKRKMGKLPYEKSGRRDNSKYIDIDPDMLYELDTVVGKVV